MRTLAEDGSPAAMEEYGEIEAAYAAADGYTIDEQLAAEAARLGIASEALKRPFCTLSGGEQVRLLLAAMFLKKHRFLLIDEPTDHLDAEGRRTMARWLAGKSGFIVVSHDRAFLDEAADHVLSINRADIEVQRGNYSSWRENRTRQDEFELAENKKLEANIGRLKDAAARTEKWSDKIEKSKKGGAAKSGDNGGTGKLDRGHIGRQAARMMQRSKSIERRRGREIDEQESLLKNIETVEALKFQVLPADKRRLVTVQGVAFEYGGAQSGARDIAGAPAEHALLHGLSFEVEAGDRIAVAGPNGSGKTTLLRLVMGDEQPLAGEIRRYGGLVISAVRQDTGFLRGNLRALARDTGVDESLFLAILRKLDFERAAFLRPMETYSAGQKKKVCLAASLAKPAHLFVWDEPLNYVDVLSREQLEAAVLEYAPTMLFVEHDRVFTERVATKTVLL